MFLRLRAFVLAGMTVFVLATDVRGQEVLTNESVIKLHAAGLPAEVIVAKIRTSQTSFDTSVDALIALSDAGLPKEIIAEMTGASSAPSSGAQTVVVRQGASAAPNVAARFGGTPCQTPGIFAQQDDKLVEVDPTTYTQGKSGSPVLTHLTYGIKSMKSRAVIQGTTANVRVAAGGLSFYFCFEETETGLSYETKGATNPSEFLLVELDVNHKKRHRHFVVGKLNVWAGATSGAPPKALRETSYEKVAPGVYKVTPRSILAPGEYGFYYAGSAPLSVYGFVPVGAGATGSGNKIFPFSVG